MNNTRKIKLNNVRLSFPNIFEKSSFQGIPGNKYDSTFLIEKNSEEFKKLKNFALNYLKINGKPEGLIDTLIKDGKTKSYAGYEGNMFVKASSMNKPILIDNSLNPITKKDEKLYPGCYVNVSISLWKGVKKEMLGANIEIIQFSKHGDTFGSKTADRDELLNEFKNLDSNIDETNKEEKLFSGFDEDSDDDVPF